jgi:hypothetical protein
MRTDRCHHRLLDVAAPITRDQRKVDARKPLERDIDAWVATSSADYEWVVRPNVSEPGLP